MSAAITEYVGRRILASLKRGAWGGSGDVEEYRVLEVSPSGNFVRLMTSFGRKFWRPVIECALVEALTPLEPHPEAKR